MIDSNHNTPFTNLWFGNFYKPAFDNFEFIDESMKKLKELGFDNIQLDAKAWEDYRERYKGMPASQYIRAQEYMMKKAKENDISFNFLALYLNGDNLYPNIRFSPPIYGESIIDLDGKDGKWYRYWSSKAQDSMIEHVKGLMKTYKSDNYSKVRIGDREALPICSMWDPIVEASFDEEGINRYRSWLKIAYQDDIKLFNQMYQTEFNIFDEIQPKDYWFIAKYGKEAIYKEEDVDKLSPAFIMWCDNMKWRRFEQKEYFKAMQKRFTEFEEDLYLTPDLAQWSYFLNVDGAKLSGVCFSDLWDTATRGIDLYELSSYVDNCTFITVPVTPAGDPNAYIVSCQHSMMRCMNYNRDYLGGIYFGRFLYNDIYNFVTPAEMIGTIVANGAKGYSAYGYCGLDDGGVLHRMDEGFNESLAKGNAWAKEVIPLIGGKKQKDIAILFPTAMAAFEPLSVSGNEIRRLDLLGWYTASCDMGLMPDVIDVNLIKENVLSNYKVLVISANDCYLVEKDEQVEQMIKAWVELGGILIHGPEDKLVQEALGIIGSKHTKDSIRYTELGLLQGDKYCSYEGDEVLATYLSDDKSAVACTDLGEGKVYSFGFYYGYSYVSKVAPHVPIEQKNGELYPVNLMKDNIYWDILEKYISTTSICRAKNLEVAQFENGVVIVNHASHPYSLKEIEGTKYFQYKVNAECLMPHSAVFIKK